MELTEVVAALRGEGGVIFLLLIAVVVFFRGGIVTGKAYEATVVAYEKRLEQLDKEVQLWQDKAIRAIDASEEALRRE